MSRHGGRERSVEREVQARLRRLERKIGDDIVRLRTDAAASKADVARAAGIDRTFYGRLEVGDAHPSLATIVAAGVALGADVSIRLYAGTGPRLTDRHQAPMIECLLGQLAPVWQPHLEVLTFRPARGFIDTVLERRDHPLLVIGEFESSLPRLEQQIRWASEKAASIGSSDLVGPGPAPRTSKLLVLRSTESTRGLARAFESTLHAAYPASTREAVESLRTGSRWPGDAIVWIRIEGDRVELLDGPPRGVKLGR
jgi:DNA-binding XRE family transcriptional regulator